MTQLKAQYGKPLNVSQIIPASDYDGTVEINFEKATVAMRMVIDRDMPHPVIGLQVTGASIDEDGIAKIKAKFDTLPGHAGFQIAEISRDQTITLGGHKVDRQFAIGSVFKLYVLAELSRQIQAGDRSWSDVVTLDQKSLPSGMIQNWPDGSPITLQTAATLMISISDNSATDLLINTIGRQNIDKLIRFTGHRQPSKTTPTLTTLEAFALKMPNNDRLRSRYVRASETEQAALLESAKSRLGRDSVSITNLATTPRHIDTIEWFASAADLSNLMAYITRLNDPVVTNILAINTIIPPGDAKRWTSFGGKGGSEPGVVSFSFIGTAKSGKTLAVSGSWNDTKEPVDDKAFLSLMNRLLNFASEQ